MVECGMCHHWTRSHIFGLCPDCWTELGQPESVEELKKILSAREKAKDSSESVQ